MKLSYDVAGWVARVANTVVMTTATVAATIMIGLRTPILSDRNPTATTVR